MSIQCNQNSHPWLNNPLRYGLLHFLSVPIWQRMVDYCLFSRCIYCTWAIVVLLPIVCSPYLARSHVRYQLWGWCCGFADWLSRSSVIRVTDDADRYDSTGSMASDFVFCIRLVFSWQCIIQPKPMVFTWLCLRQRWYTLWSWFYVVLYVVQPGRYHWYFLLLLAWWSGWHYTNLPPKHLLF